MLWHHRLITWLLHALTARDLKFQVCLGYTFTPATLYRIKMECTRLIVIQGCQQNSTVLNGSKQKNRFINSIITHADWLTEWGTLRAGPHFLLAHACNSLSLPQTSQREREREIDREKKSSRNYFIRCLILVEPGGMTKNNLDAAKGHYHEAGNTKEASITYHWPPVLLVLISLFCK